MSFNPFIHNKPSDFMLQASMGKLEGYNSEFVIGIHDDIGIGASELIWDQGGLRVTPLVGSSFFVSSDNAADTGGPVVVVTGLDDNYVRFFETVALDGQNQVELANTGNWIQSAVIVSASVVGDVYIYTASTTSGGIPDDTAAIQSKIIAGKNITRNASFMVPAGQAAITVAIHGGTDDVSKAANIVTMITPAPGQPALETVQYSVTPNFAGLLFPLPVGSAVSLLGNQPLLPERAVIEFHAQGNSNNTHVFFGTDLLMADLSLFKLG